MWRSLPRMLRRRGLSDDPQPLCRLSRIATQCTVAIGNGKNSAPNEGMATFIEAWNAEADFDAVRLVYAIVRGGERYEVAGAAVAATSLAAMTAMPTDSVGNGVAFTTMTFANQGRNVAYADQPAPGLWASTALRLDAMPGLADAAPAIIPEPVFSDWIPMASVARVDGGVGRLLVIRSLVAQGRRMIGPFSSHRPGFDASDPAAVTGRCYWKLSVEGDLLHGTPAVARATLDRGWLGRGLVLAVQLHLLRPGATVQAVGDSIIQGTGFEQTLATGGFIGFAHILCAMVSSPDCPVTLLQCGVGGERSGDFIEAARRTLAWSEVSIALIQTWSGNDSGVCNTPPECVAAADAAWDRAMRYGDLVRAQGGVPIFLSAVPQAPGMGSPEAEAARRSSITRCATLAAQGEMTFDLDGLLGDAAEITNYKPMYRWIDNIHPNTLAHYAIANAMAGTVRAIIGQPGETSPARAGMLPRANRRQHVPSWP